MAAPARIRTRRSLPALALTVALLVPASVACAGDVEPMTGRPLVIATTTVLGDIVRVVAGDDATVEVLMPVGAEPHDFQVSARQAARLRSADLVVAVGLDLEGGLTGVLEEVAADGVRVVELGEALDPVPVGGEGGAADGLDPHVWMDPVRIETAVALLAGELAGIGAGDFAGRAASYREELQSLIDDIHGAVASVPADRRVIVVDHASLGYYARRFGLEIVGTVSPSTSSAAATSTSGFADLLSLIAEREVPAVFTSVGEPGAVAEALADEAGVPVVEIWVGSLGGPGTGAETYLAMMRLTTERIVTALGGRAPDGA